MKFFIITQAGSRASLDENRPVYAACDTCGTPLKEYTFKGLLEAGPGEIPPCPYCRQMKPLKRSIKRNVLKT